MPKARKPVETFPMFLRRCGKDHKESGAECTAEDYFKAADEIDRLNALLEAERAKLAKASKACRKLANRVSSLEG